MSASPTEISNWVHHPPDWDGKSGEPRYLLVVCDEFSWEDYPVRVMTDEDVHAAIEEHSRNMQRVVEVYDLSGDLGAQLAERRAWHVPPGAGETTP